MIDKDLDSILSNIDKESEKEKARSQAMERIAPLDDDTLLEESSFSKRILPLHLSSGAKSFREGLLEKLNGHIDCCKAFRATNVNAEDDANLEHILSQYKYTFIRSIENIEKLCNDYFTVLDRHNIEKKARKEYSSFFEGYEDANKLNYVILRETFIELREFNSLIRKEWRDLAKSIGVINLASGGKELFLSLNSCIEKALMLCNETAEFVMFLAKIIGLPEDRQDLLKSEVYKLSSYSDETNYEYDAIFNIASSKPEDLNEIKAPVIESPGISETEKDLPPEKPEDESSAFSKREMSMSYTVRGTRPWNTREPYVIRLNANRLQKDHEDLAESFYFIQRPVDEKFLEGDVRRSMLVYLRNRSLNILDAYGEFILKTVFMKVQEIVSFFGAEDVLTLFAYHLGPHTVYQVIADAFASDGIGYCYKYASGNRILRHFPSEFVKGKVLEWFEHNVNAFDLPFDGIQEYENIRKMVSKKYFASVDESYNKLDKLIVQSKDARDPKFDKQALFKSKWKEWFGASNIIVYNRFLEKTIFK